VTSVMTHRFDDIVLNGQQSSFRRMMFDMCITERIEVVVGS